MVRRRVLLVSAGLLLVACGGESDSNSPAGSGTASCEANSDFVPCGGDIEGRWTLRTGCSYSEGPMPWGPEEACQAVPSALAVTYTRGSWDFRADGTVRTQIAAKAEEIAYFDDACLLEGSANPDPSQACHEWEGPIEDMESDLVIGHNACEYAGGTCTCVASMNETAQPEATGTYEVVSNEIRLDGAASGLPFCRSGESVEVQVRVPQGIIRMIWDREP